MPINMTHPRFSISDCIAMNNKGVAKLLRGDCIGAMAIFKTVLQGCPRKAAVTDHSEHQECTIDSHDQETIQELLEFTALPYSTQSSNIFLHLHVASITFQHVNCKVEDIMKIMCSVVLFNSTIAYQMLSFQQNEVTREFHSILQMHKNSLQLLPNAERQKDISLFRLSMALTNNMACIFYNICNRNGVQISLTHLRTFIKAAAELRRSMIDSSPKGQDPRTLQFESEFEINVWVFQGALSTAGAA